MELKRAYSNAPSLCDVMLWCLRAAYLPCCVGRSFNHQQCVSSNRQVSTATRELRHVETNVVTQWNTFTKISCVDSSKPFFCFDKRRLTLSTACKNPDVSLLGRKMSLTESSVRAPEAACLRFAFDSVYLPVLSKCIYRSMQKQKKRWHPSTYIKLPEPGIR